MSGFSAECIEYRSKAREKFLYLIQKYAPDREDLISELEKDQNYYQHAKYYLAEIDRANNWKTNYSDYDLNIVKDLFFYCGG